MRKLSLVLLVVFCSIVSSIMFSACSACPTCTQPEQIQKDIQEVANTAGDTYKKADRIVTDKAMEAMEPARTALENKAYQGIAIGIQAVGAIEAKFQLQATCGSASFDNNVFKANCIFIWPVDDTNKKIPDLYFVIDGKFAPSDSTWVLNDKDGTYTIEIYDVPSNITGFVFPSERVMFNGLNFTGFTMVKGTELNYGGWIKN